MEIHQKNRLASEIRAYANAIAATELDNRITQHLKDLERLVKKARKAINEQN